MNDHIDQHEGEKNRRRFGWLFEEWVFQAVLFVAVIGVIVEGLFSLDTISSVV